MDLKRQLTSFLRVPERVTLLFAGRADGTAAPVTPTDPLPVSFAPGAISDPDAAREVTLQQVLTALLALGGNTDGLEAVAAQQKAVLDQLATYSDGVEGMLSNLNSNTDGIEGLLSALGLKDDNVLAKLSEILAKDEQIRVLLAAQAARTETQPVSLAAIPLAPGASTEATLAALKGVADLMKARLDLLASDTKLEQLRVLLAALPLPTGASTSALQTAGNTSLASILGALQGTLLVRGNPDIPAIVTLNFAAGSSASDPILLNTQAIAAIDLGPNWTAADLTVEHTTDGGTTWYPMYDTFGNPVQYRISANRSVVVPLADLMRRGRIRFRSGVPGAYVNQGVVTVLTLTLVTV